LKRNLTSSITFTPSRSVGAQEEYYSRYISPLGKPRLSFKVDSDTLLARLNAPGAMEFVWILVYVASEPKGGWEFRPKERQRSGRWIGDLEPDSDMVGIWIDPELEYQQVSGFQYAPPFPPMVEGKLKLDWNSGAIIRVERSGTPSVPVYGIIGNVNGLLSLAKHLSTLAQSEVPEETRISYLPGKELISGGRLSLIMEKAKFSENVPWTR